MKWVCTRNYCSRINNKKMEEDNFSSGGSSFVHVFFCFKKDSDGRLHCIL